MRNPSCFSAGRAVTSVLGLGVCLAPSLAWAQPALNSGVLPAPRIETRVLRLRNIKPSLAAFWLDPSRHPAPEEVRVNCWPDEGIALDSAPSPPRLPGNGNGPTGLALPAGIGGIVAVDPQNGLIVSGTPEGLSALEKLLPSFDVPLVEYEVEAKFYQLELTDLPRTGLKFQAFSEETPDFFGSVASVPVDFGARIEKMVASKGARLLITPRVTLIDGLSGQLKQSTSSPIAFNEISPLPRLASAETRVQTTQRFAYITGSIGFRAKVTRVGDDLVSVAVEPRYGNRNLSVITTLHEDQPFALQMSSSKDPRQIVVVVTPRRVRRVGE